ncbi:hypothetical protein [Neorhodopirellula pilleata]|uniref:Uncharacterized protein n=1 Tax=Neorhodopirellula pilleata TaxID=2714738 RepID=A0A5C6AG70_9BACT|nr:hypothetical protein [Neorhodopirellula pilleata]TWT98964.1 hypothetical protein Pla100_21300 [Neorhodopirellula pilleata]
MAKLSFSVHRLRQSLMMAIVIPVVGMAAGVGLFDNHSAHAIEGTELNASVGLWAPLLPDIEAATTTDGESIGTIVGLRGHHRFEGYRTSIEGGVQYGVTDDVEMFGFDALLRDTWSFGIGDLSAGTGYSQMNWKQEGAGGFIDSDYRGAKVVGGWETAFGRRPLWIDLTLGLYDLNGKYSNVAGVVQAEIDEFTTTWGLDIKSDVKFFGIPGRAVFGITYLEDFTTWKGGAIGTDDAVVLTGALELLVY